jgi:glycosyltransferase involved in cell wall biosynthesis
MRVTFLTFTRREPVGGAITTYEFANALRRRGHAVNLVHYTYQQGRPYRHVDEIDWARFEDGIEHRFTNPHEPLDLPDADFHSPPHLPPGTTVRRPGLPFDVLQGYQMVFPRSFEEDLMRYPCPKVCVARWLLELARRLGIPDHQLAHIPNGIDHGKYRVVTAIEDRPMQVSMLYRHHARKGPRFGLDALAALKQRVPEARIVVFSPIPLSHDVPDGTIVYTNPSQDVIVNEIYNQSRVFLCSSVIEGFGLMSVEAMACGAALVTTDNGGSQDYAIDGETALVCAPKDSGALADRMEALLRDDERRIGLAEKGSEYVRRFDWDRSGEQLEAFFRTYELDPERYQQPASEHVSTAMGDRGDRA